MVGEARYDNAPPGIELRLKWRRTWPDREHDFVGVDMRFGEQSAAGRFYWVNTSNPVYDRWTWAITGDGFFGGAHGAAKSAREAAAAIEREWFAALERLPAERVAARMVDPSVSPSGSVDPSAASHPTSDSLPE